MILLILLSSMANAGSIYSHNEYGAFTGGSKAELVNAFNSGKRISFIINVKSNATKQLFHPSRLFLSESELYAEVPLYSLNHSYANGIDFRYDGVNGVAVFGTDGKEVVKVKDGKFINRFQIEWMVE